MVIAKKRSKIKSVIDEDVQALVDQAAVDAVIERGGKTTADDAPKKVRESKKEKTSILLRVPKYLVRKIDEARKNRPGVLCRNEFIVEALHKASRKVNDD